MFLKECVLFSFSTGNFELGWVSILMKKLLKKSRLPHRDNIHLTENAPTRALQLIIVPRKLHLVVTMLAIGPTRLTKVIKCYNVTYIQPLIDLNNILN